jgi:hypothetical protein
VTQPTARHFSAIIAKLPELVRKSRALFDLHLHCVFESRRSNSRLYVLIPMALFIGVI